MTNLFSTGLSGLNTASAALATTGHNTANVDTTGYTKQSTQITSLTGTYVGGTGFIGSGSMANGVTRSYNQYLTTQLNAAQSTTASLSTQQTQVGQIDTLLASSTTDLSTQITGFFTAVASVANAPSDSSARQSMISSAESLATQFRSASDYLSQLQSSANDEITGSVSQINTYASQIANLNQQIAQLTTANPTQQPNDLLDQRDLLVNQLSQVVNAKVVVQDGGQYNVFIGTGQTLVLGNQASTLTTTPSVADPTKTVLAVKNVNGTTTEVPDSMITGGSLGGMIAFRDGTLSNVQNSIGRLALAVGTAVNDQQNLGIDLTGVAGKNLFTVATPTIYSNTKNTGNLTVSGTVTDANALTTSDYKMTVGIGGGGVPQYTVTRLSDNAVVVNNATTMPLTFDGVTLTAGTGTPQAGDTYTIKPTATGATGLTTLITDPTGIAAATPITVAATTSNTGTGTISSPSVDKNYLTTPLGSTLTLTYDKASNSLNLPGGANVTVTKADGTSTVYPVGTSPQFTAGATYTINGMSFVMNGTPATGDTFTISKNTSGVSDGSNALLIGKLQTDKTMSGSTATFTNAYAQVISLVGTTASSLSISYTSQNSLATQIQTQQQSVSGVNQDEETANLLMYQQMYQANAKVIQTASTIFDAILAIN